MKHALISLSLLMLATPALYAQTTSAPPLMNFQGRLSKPNGTPLPDGTYAVLFSFYDAATNGTLQWSENLNVTVHNGAFAVLLGKFNALNDSVFAGNRWLELKIGSGPALAPRQQLVSAAYAFKADTVPDSSITGVKIAAGTITADKFAAGVGAFALPYAATVNSASNLFSITNSGTGSGIFGSSNGGYGSGGVTGTDTNANGTGVIGTGGGTGVFGSSAADYGAGLYGQDFAALGTGVSGHGGANGVYGANTNNTSALPSAGGFAGVVGIGGGTGVEGYSTVSNGAGVIGEANGSSASGVRGSSTSGTGVYASGLTGVYGTGSTYAGYFSGEVDVNNGLKYGGVALRVFENPVLGVGIGVGDLAPFGQALYETNTSVPMTHMFFAENGTGVFSVAAGGATIIESSLRVRTINIVGGSDVAEPYQVAAHGEIKPLPGMVVAIDAAQVGQMRVVGKAYDKTVSGIISGANGIQPGITLSQKGTVADGTFPVASIGRVWCWCDADANGAIEAGDMLTTSDTPGHAMRVTDFNRANGSIIGKAMSPLKSGKGLVLVLVSLK